MKHSLGPSVRDHGLHLGLVMTQKTSFSFSLQLACENNIITLSGGK